MTDHNKDKTGFASELIKSWEDSDGVNFAIALARTTEWLLHVDWWTTNNGKEPIDQMKSLRVYVGDNMNNIFDVSGIQKLEAFNNKTIMPIAMRRGKGKGGILTRYYSEQKLFELPLRVRPEEAKILIAEKAIRHNSTFLEKIPVRLKPHIPSHLAANYTFGRCAVYATALHDLTQLPATAIIANRYSSLFALFKPGYAHSIVLHSDGTAEDAWGRQSIEKILERYGIMEYSMSESEHIRVNENLQRNSPGNYIFAYEEAINLIKEYCLR